MSREKKARAGAQALIPDDTITDVALTVPHGATMASVLGAAVGGSITQGTGGTNGAWVPMGMVVGERMAATKAGLPLSIVLAASPTAVYALDTTTGAKLRVEAQNVGNLGIKKFLAGFSV
ncbi:MAG TPA: hypothetical protein VIT41_10410 [Microlunatus sp.]